MCADQVWLLWLYSITVVVGRVLVGRTGKLDEGEIGKHLTPPAAVHHPPGRNERHSGEHGEDFVRGRMDGQDHNPSTCRPLTQVLDEEERVEDVHALSRLV